MKILLIITFDDFYDETSKILFHPCKNFNIVYYTLFESNLISKLYLNERRKRKSSYK